jgi:hypothetical protein
MLTNLQQLYDPKIQISMRVEKLRARELLESDFTIFTYIIGKRMLIYWGNTKILLAEEQFGSRKH